MIVYKATRPDGTDFRTGKIKYGKRVKHPSSKKMVRGDASTYLSFSKVPTDCTGFRWPCRLISYETVGETLDGIPSLPNKVACLEAVRIEELPAWQVFGPQGEAVVALIEKAKTITPEQAGRLHAARVAARDDARVAAIALVAKDLITESQFNTLYGPWASVMEAA